MFLAKRCELQGIRSFVEGFCAQASLPRETCVRLNVVLEEVFVNTVMHGYHGDNDAPVWITLDPRPSGVRVTYEDTAPPFNPLTYAVETGKVGGLGVLLTRELATAREYAYIFGRNRIRLSLAA
jgi:anti-sigma regulatory factor (Ser/Thr protein kinase)